MSGLDLELVCHSLCIDPKFRPVKQPQRIFEPEITLKIKEEVERLLKVGFIKPIAHPQGLADVVLVKKKNVQLRCCIDFRDLNKACPKDGFPLPNVLIDSTTGHELFSFLDAYSGYNQIFMDPADAPHTAFKTPIGNFYYKMMPFGLKNVRVTYQRAMTSVFNDMIHKEIEFYVDDGCQSKEKRRALRGFEKGVQGAENSS
ncbi:PREDICTED: uncharacterized protein LOC109115727 [Nelumbo nucifera]|uniref:Uncharacterized protein LOC109115727 n=1 Tax=Nelumbo nucifera TaxID=4432 RepID=A0A1U8QAJ6_NELNU|nr:PREDICTED: uncharacterized protein LOC109115727 [Nelumbo nucifera]